MDVTYELTTIDAIRHEAVALIPVQHRETGQSDMPAAPNWDAYEALERHRALGIMAVRRDGCLIGYGGFVLHPALNSVTTRIATISTYYVTEGAFLWRAVVLRNLFERLIDEAFRRGACQVCVETEIEHSAGRLLESMGFRVHKIGYMLSAPTGALPAERDKMHA